MQDVKIYYMRDNHTFKLLSLDVETALHEINEEWEAGYTSGMVCSKASGMPPSVHSRGKGYWYEFTQAVLVYYAAAKVMTPEKHYEGVDMIQDKLMVVDPATGGEKPYPSHAAQWREYHGTAAWLFNPWTGQRRKAEDVGSDTFGLLILPPDAQLHAAV